MPQGTAECRTGRRADDPSAPQPSAGRRAHGRRQGKSTAAVRLALRAWNQGWPIGVFQFVKSAKVEGRRGERAARARRLRAGRHRRLAQDGRGAGPGSSGTSRVTTRPTRRRPARAGSRSSGTWPPRRTGCTCSTSSPTRCTGAGSTPTRSSTSAQPARNPARGDHRAERAGEAGGLRRPRHRHVQGQAPHGRGPEGPEGHRVVTRSVPRLVVAAPSSGSGKTTVATGLMAAFAARGARRVPAQGRAGLHRPRVPRPRDRAGGGATWTRTCAGRSWSLRCSCTGRGDATSPWSRE